MHLCKLPTAHALSELHGLSHGSLHLRVHLVHNLVHIAEERARAREERVVGERVPTDSTSERILHHAIHHLVGHLALPLHPLHHAIEGRSVLRPADHHLLLVAPGAVVMRLRCRLSQASLVRALVGRQCHLYTSSTFILFSFFD